MQTKNITQILAEGFNLTKPDDQEELKDILTEEEKKSAIEFATLQMQRGNSWKLSQWKNILSKADIEEKITDFQLDEIDEKEIIIQANIRKHIKIKAEQLRIENSKAEELIFSQKEQELKKYDASYFYKLLKANAKIILTAENHRYKELIINDQTLPLIKILCLFFSKDPRFETELGFSHGKGLLIRGDCGLGKSFLIKCLAQNPRFPVFSKSMLNILDEIKQYGNFKFPSDCKKFNIDDFGTEESPIVNFYGTKINWGKEFIEKFYLNAPDQFDKLIISTNKNFSELEEYYGFRFRSRAKQMFNVIDVNGSDMR